MNRHDIIVFGATGFTGKFVVKILASLTKKSEYFDIAWAISGRCKEKLENLLEELGNSTQNIQAIQCDVKNEVALKTMTRQARVVVNCVGPYTTLGEPVVRACIETGTHYVDIAAELFFMLEMYRKYHRAAEEAKVLIISACGFGSIPGVMGYTKIEKEFKGVLKTVECYTEFKFPRRVNFPGPNKILIHDGTWKSFVNELKNYKQYGNLKKQTFPEPLETDPEPASHKKSFFHRNMGRYWLPYVGPDGDIVEMTQRYLHKTRGKKPIQFNSYFTMPLLIHILILVPAFFLVYMLSYFKFFRKLLRTYPRLFSFGYISHKGPSEEMMEDTKFCLTIVGRGWDTQVSDSNTPFNRSMTLKVSGTNPGYGITATALVMSAITILKDSSSMPSGGVIPSGAALWDTLLVDRLNQHGISFEIQDNNI